MNAKIIIIMIAIISLFNLGGLAQIQSRKATPKQSKQSDNLLKHDNKDNINLKRPVIIAIENVNVYTDHPEGGIRKGDLLEVFEDGDNFIHPVTGDLIPKESNSLAQLVVTKIFDKYLECRVSPSFAIANLKPGMLIKISSNNDDIADEEIKVQDQSLTSSNFYENEFLEVLRKEINNCKKDNKAISYNESIEINGKTITINTIVNNKFIFGQIKKNNKKKIKPLWEEMQLIDKYVLYYLGRKAGYKFIVKTYNKKKSEYIETIYDFKDYSDQYSSDYNQTSNKNSSAIVSDIIIGLF